VSNVSVARKLKRLDAKIRACQLCRLAKTRKHAVPGEGSANAQIMFIGEAPGRKEDLVGRPFVGGAGKIFDELLSSINLNRELIYITNVVKCRPTTVSTTCNKSKWEVANNRKPLSDEVGACTLYLTQQIKLLKPKIICTLGHTASEVIFKRYDLRLTQISKIRGRVICVGSLKIMPMYHPAAALYTAHLKDNMIRDFKDLSVLLYGRPVRSLRLPYTLS
jgi:DNA polymerase